MTFTYPGIVFFGTPKLSVYTLKTLVESGFPVKAVVTKPDRKCGRNRAPQFTPVKVFAKRKGIPVYQPESLKNPDFIQNIADLKPEFFVVVAFGKIIPQKLLAIPTQESLNIHFSLLPKYRGASPVATAILNGETESGVSIIQVAKKLDSGDIYHIVNDTISPEENTCDVEDKLIKKGTDALIEVLKDFNTFKNKKLPQDHSLASHARIIKKEDGQINWSDPAKKIWCEIRAFNPWPCAYTSYRDLYVKLIKAEPMDKTFKDHSPGTVVGIVPKHGFIISCGTGSLLIKELQPANKRKMTAIDFINGYRLQVKDKFE